MSLKELLHQKIHEMGYLSYGEMCGLVNEWEYKVATAERRLRGLCARKSEAGLPQTPEIAPIMKRGKRTGGLYISGWEWIAAPKRFETVNNFVPQTATTGSTTNFEIKLPYPFKVAPKETKNQTLGI